MGQAQSGPAGPIGPIGPIGPKGENVKAWGEWIESDKDAFLNKIKTDESFKESVKNKIASDIEFRSAIANIIKDDSIFKSDLYNILSSDQDFRANIATNINNSAFKTDIKGRIITDLKGDETFKQSITGQKGEPGQPGEISLVQLNENLRSKSLWCADGSCIVPPGNNLRLNNSFSMHPDGIFELDFPNIPGGKFKIDKDGSARFGKDISLGATNISTNSVGDLLIKAGDKTWTFGSNGTLYTPGDLNVGGNIEQVKGGVIQLPSWSIDGTNDLNFSSNGNPSAKYILAKNNDTSSGYWLQRGPGW